MKLDKILPGRWEGIGGGRVKASWETWPWGLLLYSRAWLKNGAPLEGHGPRTCRVRPPRPYKWEGLRWADRSRKPRGGSVCIGRVVLSMDEMRMEGDERPKSWRIRVKQADCLVYCISFQQKTHLAPIGIIWVSIFMLLDVTDLVFGPAHAWARLSTLVVGLSPENHTLFPSLRPSSILILVLPHKWLIYRPCDLGLAKLKSS